jgi:hypothetical protein
MQSGRRRSWVLFFGRQFPALCPTREGTGCSDTSAQSLGLPSEAARTSPSGPNLIQNGDFEGGDLAWTISPGVITNQEQAYGGFWCAWMGGYGKTHTVSQVVELPASGSSAELLLYIETEEVQDKVFDTSKVQIAGESGNVLQTLHTFSNRAATPHDERSKSAGQARASRPSRLARGE